MRTKIYTFFFNLGQILKRALAIENFEAFKKKNKRRIFRFIYKKKYNTHDLLTIMISLGMKKGSIVFIHSSMTEFYNYTGTADELIHGIIKCIGPEGTLMMPAYPKNNKYNGEVDFDVQKSNSGAGYLSEVFRKYKGSQRSIHIQHSVSAYGKLAEYFVSEHYKSITAWDKYSPYYKMCEYDTLVFSFGLSYFLGTMIHCTESILREKYSYFQLFFKKNTSYTYKDYQGNLGAHFYFTHDIARKRSKKKIIKKYFEKDQFHKVKISNLRIEMVKAKYTLNLFLSLAERGITMYSIPSPSKYKDDNNRFYLIK